jgi:hypothetical protein
VPKQLAARKRHWLNGCPKTERDQPNFLSDFRGSNCRADSGRCRIALWFGVSDLSRLPGAHRRQKVASASLAMQDMSEDKTSSLASGAVEIRRPRCHGTVSDVVLESCCPPTLRYGVSVALSQITCVGVCVVSVTRCLCSGLVSLVSMDV